MNNEHWVIVAGFLIFGLWILSEFKCSRLSRILLGTFAMAIPVLFGVVHYGLHMVHDSFALKDRQATKALIDVTAQRLTVKNVDEFNKLFGILNRKYQPDLWKGNDWVIEDALKTNLPK